MKMIKTGKMLVEKATGNALDIVTLEGVAGYEGVEGVDAKEFFGVESCNDIIIPLEGIVLKNFDIVKKGKEIVKLSDVGVDIVKEVGVIEFLEKEIALKNRAIELNRKDGFEMLACVAERELESIKQKRDTAVTALELFNNLTWKDGHLYKMENFLATTEEYSQEEHEEWERKVKDPNENGGVL